MRRVLSGLIVLVALLAAWPAAAQEQRGVIEGIVRDSSGAVLPGVTVEARTSSGAVLTATTDGTGTYRFPTVPPGDYVVTATLENFAPGKNNVVRVGLGQVKKVDFTLAPGGLTESVQVSAESPLVDVRQSARQTNIRAEQVELLPKGRDFTTLVTQAPGANNEPKLGGLSIDGASAGENRFIIDGIETTSIRNGTSAQLLIADFVEEVQVKSSGYTAEFGGAMGGVINAITKSGSNDWRGSGLFNMQGSALNGKNRPTLRQNLTNSDLAEYITYPEDDSVRIEPGFAIGGPIARDRSWFFGAYQPALTTNDRSVDAASAQNPSAVPNGNEQEVQVQNVTGNVTSQLTDSLRARVAYNNSWGHVKGLLPSLNASDLPGSDYGKTTTFPAWSLSANMDWVASSNLFFGVRGGYSLTDTIDENVTEVPRYNWPTTTNIGLLDVPVALQQPVGFTSVLTNTKVLQDKQTRAYFQADGTVFGNWGGSHQLKFGVQVDRLGNQVDSGEAAMRVTLRWNARLSSNVVNCNGVSGPAGLCRGTYGYYSVRSNAADPKRGFITSGDINMNVAGLFIQDAWTINNKLTVNAGIRTEREAVPYYDKATAGTDFGFKFGFADKMAPRLGVAYDLKGDGRSKLFGSWGVFYDIFKLELPRGSFGGDKWLEYYYTLDTFEWPTLVDDASCPPACPGQFMRVTDFRHVSVGSEAIDPDLKPMRMQEATAGFEHQLNDRLALSVRYVHKQIDRAIEDTQTATLDADGNEIYIIANPGEGLAVPAVRVYDADGNATDEILATIPKAKRDYDSVELALEKRFADNWYLRGSYLWSRLYGNYPGLSQSDENGRTSPNVGRLFDYPMMMFMDGGQPVFGPLPTDRPHQFKTQFIYQFPFGTSVGVNQFAGSGLPVTRELGVYPGNNLPVQYLGRGSDGRTPILTQTDLLVQHAFRFAGRRQVQLSLNVLNLFNQDAAISRHSTYEKVNGVTPLGPSGTEEEFYRGQLNLADLIAAQGVAQDPRFLMDNGFQLPISARVGVKFTF